ncbi:hypothetical protein HDU91_000483 [Kappamyces sp. JEL0680]|nr:hypothetical protein HDU91_000483 [Kappamyces sp. JEL0680]
MRDSAKLVGFTAHQHGPAAPTSSSLPISDPCLKLGPKLVENVFKPDQAKRKKDKFPPSDCISRASLGALNPSAPFSLFLWYEGSQDEENDVCIVDVTIDGKKSPGEKAIAVLQMHYKTQAKKPSMIKTVFSSELGPPVLSSTVYSSPLLPQKHIFKYHDLHMSSEQDEAVAPKTDKEALKKKQMHRFNMLASIAEDLIDAPTTLPPVDILMADVDQENVNPNAEPSKRHHRPIKAALPPSDGVDLQLDYPAEKRHRAGPVSLRDRNQYRKRIPMTLQSDLDTFTLRITIDHTLKVSQLENTIKSFLQSQDNALEPEDADSISWMKDGQLHEWGALQDQNVFSVEAVLIKL